MEQLLELLKSLKPGDYLFLAIDFLVVVLVIFLVVRSIKRRKKAKKEEHLEELLTTEEYIEEVKEEAPAEEEKEETETLEVKEEVEVNEVVEETLVEEKIEELVKEEVEVNEEVKANEEVETLEIKEEIKEEVKEEVKVNKVKKVVKDTPKENKKVSVKRKEPVKVERVEKLEKEEYTSENPFELTRILLPNKQEYKLGKGWENTFKRARRNEDFKNNLWPFIYNSYQEDKEVTPSLENLFKPFEYCDPSHTKVVFINKQPGLSIKEDGLAFSTKEIYKKTPLFNELYDNARSDRKVRAIRYDDGDLENWAKQGVFLYNYILLNAQGETKKHENAGYEVFSNMVIKDLVKDNNPKVFVVFTNHVYSNFMSILGNNTNHKVIFISSPAKIKDTNIFGEINDFLASKGIEPINWSLGKIRK